MTPPESLPDSPQNFADLRAEFERLSRLTPRDPRAERAFIESKIELVRSDPRLSEAEKDRAIEDLKRRLAG
jgi:hypothetical protein